MVIRKPGVPACAQPKLQPKYSPDMTSPTAIAQRWKALRVLASVTSVRASLTSSSLKQQA